jgi:hypothetical protein
MNVKQIEAFVQTWIWKLVAPGLGTIVGALMIFLLYQNADTDRAQANDIKDNRAYTNKIVSDHCEKAEITWNKKVDDVDFNRMFNFIIKQQDEATVERREDRKIRQEQVKIMQKMQLEMGAIPKMQIELKAIKEKIK